MSPTQILHYKMHKGLWQYLRTQYDKPKGLSWFYYLLQNNNNFVKTSNMSNWEKELGLVHSPNQWQSAIHSSFRHSHCTNHWDQMLKILHKSYLTPARLSLIFPSEMNTCWRQCGSKGSIIHILWDCKNIRSFWYAIFKQITSVTGFIIKPTPHLAPLNLSIDTIPFQFRSIITHILIADRLTITATWKTTLSPNTEEVVRRVKTQHSYEKYFAIQTNNLKSFNNHWAPWTSRFPDNG